MALVLKDRVRETTTSTGTGAVTLAGPYAGFQAFSVIGNGNTTFYAISDPNTGAWEVGIGTYTSVGNTLSRDTVLESTNSGSLVSFAAGTKDVILTQPAERAVYVDGTSVAAPGATVPNALLANSSVTVNGSSVSLGGSVTVTANTPNTLTRGTYLTGNNFNGSAATTWAVDADTANTASKVVARDASGNFAAGTITATRFSGPVTGAIGDVTPSTGAFTTLSASSTVSGTGFSTYLASPPAIGSTTANTGAFTTLSASSTVSGTGFSTYLASPPAIGSTTANTGAFTTLSASSTVSGTGFSTYLASPPAIGSTTANTGAFTTLSASSTVSGTGFSNYLAAPPAIGGTTPNTGSFTTLTASGNSTFSSTGSLTISKGTTAQRPGTPATGMIRYNTSTNVFEGYSGASPAWKSIGGATLSNDLTTTSDLYPVFANATTGAADTLYTSNAKLLYRPSTGELQSSIVEANNGIFVNSATVSVSYSIPSGSNGMSAGPVTIASGVTVTVPSGSVWTVV